MVNLPTTVYVGQYTIHGSDEIYDTNIHEIAPI